MVCLLLLFLIDYAKLCQQMGSTTICPGSKHSPSLSIGQDNSPTPTTSSASALTNASTSSACSSSSAAPKETNSISMLTTRKKEDFLILAELGEGSYSTVYLASERETSRKFAVKICFKKKIMREKKVQQIFRERDILRLLSTPENSSPFIVTLYCTFQDQDSLYFVLTLAGKKDLLSRLKSLGGRFTIAQTQFVMAQLWSAIAHIHSLKVIHRDIKPENILLRDNGHILLSDFGCAKRLDVPTEENNKDDGGREGKAEERQNGKEQQKTRLKRRSSFVGTAQYVSPEVLNGEEVTTACDWWAFAVILFELLAGHRPFSGESEYLLYQQILKLNYKFPDNFPSAEARQLIQQILLIPPAQRLGSAERGGPLRIREDAFFAGVHWDELARQQSPLFPTMDKAENNDDR